MPDDDAALRTAQAHADVLSTVSHDIRAPLGVIHGAVAELLGAQLGTLTDDQRSVVQLIRRSTEKLGRLAANVLVLQKLELGKIELRRQRVDIRVLARRALEAFERSGELTRLRVTSEIAPDAAYVDVDPERAIHAIANVIANAVRFARSDVRLLVASEGGDSADATITVEDDGPGLSAAQLPLLFDREARSRAPEGSMMRGFGLIVTRAILDAHGGRASAHPRIDDAGRSVGAAVSLTFPRVP